MILLEVKIFAIFRSASNALVSASTATAFVIPLPSCGRILWFAREWITGQGDLTNFTCQYDLHTALRRTCLPLFPPGGDQLSQLICIVCVLGVSNPYITDSILFPIVKDETAQWVSLLNANEVHSRRDDLR